MDFHHIGAFIRSYRQANGESLHILSNRSGVSRSMIAQIESGQTNPTILVLAKLANAMNIKLGDLVDPPVETADINIVSPSSENMISPKKSAFICHHLFGNRPLALADFYYFYFKRHGKTAFKANIPGSSKYLWLESGHLIIHLAGKRLFMSSGEMTSFNASIPHRFECRENELAKGIFLVSYEHSHPQN